MRIDLYIAEGIKEVVLKPESEYENEVCNVLSKLPNTYRGDFNECKAGYIRNFYSPSVYGNDKDKDLIIVLREEQK